MSRGHRRRAFENTGPDRPHVISSLFRSRIFSAGDDGFVRLLPTDATASENALLIEDTASPITWVDADRDRLVVASEDGSVRMYKHHNDDDETQGVAVPLAGVLSRSSLPARCVALEKSLVPNKTPRAAICTEELIVKLVDVGDTRRVSLLTGHNKAVRAASWSPKNATLVTSACDGTARVWDCSSSEPACTKVLDNLPVTKAEDESHVQALWHPSGDYFILPSKGNELVSYTNSSVGWSRSGTFSAPSRGSTAIEPAAGSITAMAFCPNGRYLAVATSDERITIWDSSSRQPIRRQIAETTVTGISWDPSADNLAWVDTNGQLTRWLGVMGSAYPSPHEAISTTSAVDRATTARSRVDDLFADIEDDEDDEDQQDEEESRRPSSRFIDGEAQDRRRGDSEGEENDDDVAGEDGLDDFVVDDDAGDYSAALEKERRQRPIRKSLARPSTSYAVSKAQSAFQPNSTPMRNSRQFLSLSLFGSLLSIDQDTHHVVSFESFDSAARRNWKMVDHFGYTMASVGSSGALLACPAKGESLSAVHYKPFEAAGAWSTPGAEWGVELPKGEEIVAIAMGGAPARRQQDDEDDIARAAAQLTSTAIVATSAGYLRFFSASGLQRYVWALGCQVVTMAAGKQHAIVVHRGQAAIDGYQNLSYTLIDLISFEVRQTGALPLSREVELRWIGFNELDIAAFYDARGVLHLLDRAFAAPGQARWTPVLDTRTIVPSKGTEEDSTSTTSRTQFWPLSMSATQLYCVFVRGALSYPDPSASGHPMIQEVDLKLPLLGLDQPAGELEEKHLRQSLLASSIRSSFGALVVPPTEYASDLPDPSVLVHQSDKDLLQLIQISCKSEKHARALDAARELHGTRMLDAALQIAAFFHLPTLGERMNALRDWIETRAERDERLEREGPAGAPVEDFAEAASRSRMLAPSSQSPHPPAAGGAASSSVSAFARKALTEDFHTSSATPRRSQALRGSSSFGASSPAPSMPPPAASRSALQTSLANNSNGFSMGADDVEDMDEDLDAAQRDIGDESSSSIGRKRKYPAYDEDESAMMPPPPVGLQKQRSTSNPFNKTTLSSSTAKSNPFARQPGMIRDRSMHKSNSFFDRAEADLTQDAATAQRSASGSKKTKQSTLFGTGGAGSSAASKKKQTGSSSQAKAPAIPAASAAFGVTQVEEDYDSQLPEEQSIRATLDDASEREDRREARGGLEETQMIDEDESQDMEGPGEEDGRSKLDAFRHRPSVLAA